MHLQDCPQHGNEYEDDCLSFRIWQNSDRIQENLLALQEEVPLVVARAIEQSTRSVIVDVPDNANEQSDATKAPEVPNAIVPGALPEHDSAEMPLASQWPGNIGAAATQGKVGYSGSLC